MVKHSLINRYKIYIMIHMYRVIKQYNSRVTCDKTQ